MQLSKTLVDSNTPWIQPLGNGDWFKFTRIKLWLPLDSLLKLSLRSGPGSAPSQPWGRTERQQRWVLVKAFEEN